MFYCKLLNRKLDYFRLKFLFVTPEVSMKSVVNKYKLHKQQLYGVIKNT